MWANRDECISLTSSYVLATSGLAFSRAGLYIRHSGNGKHCLYDVNGGAAGIVWDFPGSRLMGASLLNQWFFFSKVYDLE